MRMKKIVGGFLCLLLLVGCQSAKRNPAMDLMRSASYLEDYDVQIGYENAEGCFFKYHSVYYMNLGGWVYYYDTKSEQGGKVCGKVECSHDTVECNAYLGITVPGIQVYNGKLYWISGVLNRMDLDGNNRESCGVVDGMSGLNPRMYLHRGSLYTCIITAEAESGANSSTVRIMRYDLDDLSVPAEEVFTQSYTYTTGYRCRFYRNQLYIMIDEPMNLDIGHMQYNRSLYMYDIVSKELKTVWSTVDYSRTRSICVTEDGLEFMNYNTDGAYVYANTEDTWRVWRSSYHCDTQEMEQHESHIMEPGYTVVYWVYEYYIAFRSTLTETGETAMYRIYDEDWALLGEGALVGHPTVVGADERGVLVDTNRGGGEGVALYQISWTHLNAPQKLMEHVFTV